jgi:nitrite reductase/ring-hydroxylating ferredoxin subunit
VRSPNCPLTRRRLVAGVGAAGLSVLVAACGGGEAPAGARQSGAPVATSAPAGGSAAATAAPTPPPGASTAAAAPRVLTRTADVPVGGGVIVQADGPTLVVQPTAGVFKAFNARCPHQGIVVGLPDSNGVITCPGHRAHYRAANGSLIDGPSPRGLEPIPVSVANGQVRRA